MALPDLRHSSGSQDQGCVVQSRPASAFFSVPLHRGEMDALFLTTSKPFRVASSYTVSRWITSGISECYPRRSLDSQFVTSGFSTSDPYSGINLYQDPSFRVIMAVLSWSSPSTLQKGHPKDVGMAICSATSKVFFSCLRETLLQGQLETSFSRRTTSPYGEFSFIPYFPLLINGVGLGGCFAFASQKIFV